MQKKNSIIDLAGAWSDVSEKEAQEFKKEIANARKNSEIRES